MEVQVVLAIQPTPESLWLFNYDALAKAVPVTKVTISVCFPQSAQGNCGGRRLRPMVPSRD